MINFDSSDTSRPQNIDGEIEGRSSRHGKVSFLYMKNLLEKNSINIDDYKFLLKKSNEELFNNIVSIINELENENNSIISLKEFTRARNIKDNKNKLISRLQSLQFIKSLYYIMKSNNKLADKIITNIFRYALSIQTHQFTSPRYLRVL
jgi:hypothetical protein